MINSCWSIGWLRGGSHVWKRREDEREMRTEQWRTKQPTLARQTKAVVVVGDRLRLRLERARGKKFAWESREEVRRDLRALPLTHLGFYSLQNYLKIPLIFKIQCHFYKFQPSPLAPGSRANCRKTSCDSGRNAEVGRDGACHPSVWSRHDAPPKPRAIAPRLTA